MIETIETASLSGPIEQAGERAAFGGAGASFGGVSSPIGIPDPTIAELLPPHFYVEEEYFVSGTVSGRPYKTTLLIRRPRDPAQFSGVGIIEPVHLQGALGLWQTGHPVILEGGHLWAAVGSQLGALEGPVKLSNPGRYADLHIPLTAEGEQAIAELDAWQGKDVGGVPAAAFAVDPVSNAILAQVGALLKAGKLDGFAARHLILGGASQTGGATLNFIKAAHAAARLPDGAPIYDGFLPMAAPGWEPVAGGDAAVVHIFAEGDIPLFDAAGADGLLSSRPDGDAPGDRYRSYQIAGCPHLPTRGLRDATGIPQLGLTLEPNERLTQFPAAPFYRAALFRLVKWLTGDAVPPAAPAIEFSGGEIARDEFGNARGGIRSPYVDMPTVSYIAARYVRNLIGVEKPFAPETLQQLYGSRDDYLQRFDQAIDRAVAEEWLLPADGAALKGEEAAMPPF